MFILTCSADYISVVPENHRTLPYFVSLVCSPHLHFECINFLIHFSKIAFMDCIICSYEFGTSSMYLNFRFQVV